MKKRAENIKFPISAREAKSFSTILDPKYTQTNSKNYPKISRHLKILLIPSTNHSTRTTDTHHVNYP